MSMTEDMLSVKMASITKEIFQMCSTIWLHTQCPRTLQKHYEVAMFQFQDLATLFGVHIPPQTNTDKYTAQMTGQLAIEQRSPNNQDSQNVITSVTALM